MRKSGKSWKSVRKDEKVHEKVPNAEKIRKSETEDEKTMTKDWKVGKKLKKWARKFEITRLCVLNLRKCVKK